MFRMGKLITSSAVTDGAPMHLASKALAALAARERVAGGPSLDDLKADDLQLVIFADEVNGVEVRSPQPKQRIGVIALAALNGDLFDSSRAMLVKSGELLQVRDRMGRGIVTMVEDADAWLVSPIAAETGDRTPLQALGDSLSDETVLVLREMVRGGAFELAPDADPAGDDGYTMQRSLCNRIDFEQVRDEIEAAGFNQWLHRYQHNINQPWKLVIAVCDRAVAATRMQEMGLNQRAIAPRGDDAAPSI